VFQTWISERTNLLDTKNERTHKQLGKTVRIGIGTWNGGVNCKDWHDCHVQDSKQLFPPWSIIACCVGSDFSVFMFSVF
ncbi:unnamed protein product, partial [Discosporangium mesarthrocarpum]